MGCGSEEDKGKKDEKERPSQVTDKRDGKTYKTIKIGNQVWMAENLAYKPSNGNYWAYDDENFNLEKYGYLYDWETAQNICLSGWHLPSDDEWTTLTDYLGGQNVAGIKMKSTSGWIEDGNGTNESGFNGLPGGYHSASGNYFAIDDYALWWSSTQSSTINAWKHYLNYRSAVYRNDVYKELGFSVRCLKD
jgi:uncharacterized protein (TIGR02145 family)